MNKKTFYNSELLIIESSIKCNRKFNIRINKCGNIDIKFNNAEDNEHFVLYLVGNNQYLWRRHVIGYWGEWYEYPLNMKRNLNKPYTVSDSYFNNLKEAINYFNYYLKKYRKY